MAEEAQSSGAKKGATFLLSPIFVLVATAVVLAVLLTLPINVPIGAMYWDLFIYFDAANRIFGGQVPSSDFFAPVGPLGYYLFTGSVWLFPNAQPLLLVHWSLLAVTGPLLAVVLWQVDGKSRGQALALLVPFLIFAVLPFNTREFYPYPGSDGFGIYNRQVCQLLYVLAAGLLFLRDQRLMGIVVTLVMVALFLTKITGFVAGAMLCVFAFAAGRIGWRAAVASAVGFLASLGILELWSGFTSAYLRDILILVEVNAGNLIPRFLRAASHTFGIVAPATALLILLLHSVERHRLTAEVRSLRTSPSFRGIAAILDHNAFWVGAILFAGIFFETQNTGSQALIFLWPALLATVLALRQSKISPGVFAVAMVLVAAAALPPAINVVERAARTYLGAAKNVVLPEKNLKTLGRVDMRPEVLERAETMLDFYREHRETYGNLADFGQLPGYILYSDFDFQITHLMAIDQAVASLKALEDRTGVRFETMMALNFVNPFPWLMNRSAPLHVAIGADPDRAVPPLDENTKEAVRATDILLLPTCPITAGNVDLLEHYAPALTHHRRITLDNCYDALVHPKFAGKLGP